ncbi:hypothetical protein ACQ5SO_17275 [Rhodovulum sp. DZ06]|uniref:hypothetical protein n=1 Tax=Rhodovulum sp. DZ06 TaxID=3425126 RepID=UPI003D329F0F
MIDLIPADLPPAAPEVIGAFWNIVIQLALLALSVVLGVVMRKKPPTPPAAGLEDFEPNGKEIGSPILAFGGSEGFKPVPLYMGDLRTTPVRGKGGKK